MRICHIAYNVKAIRPVLFLFLLTLYILPSHNIIAEEISRAPIPGWVIERDIKMNSILNEEKNNGGI